MGNGPGGGALFVESAVLTAKRFWDRGPCKMETSGTVQCTHAHLQETILHEVSVVRCIVEFFVLFFFAPKLSVQITLHDVAAVEEPCIRPVIFLDRSPSRS